MARHFDGTAHLQAANTGSFSPSPCSIFYWVKTSTAALRTTFYAGVAQYNIDSFASVTQAVGRYVGGAPTAGRQCVSTTSFPISGADEWHQVVCLYSGTAFCRVYVDGNHIGDMVDAGAEWMGNAPQIVWGAGNRGGYDNHFTGDLADLCLWFGYLLTEAEIAYLWESPVRPNAIAPGFVVGYWPLPETGELTNVAGGTTFGALTNVNTTTSPDPPYTLPPPVMLVYAPPYDAPWPAYSPAAPLGDKLLSWWPGVRPYTEYWNNREGHTSIISAGNTELREGQDNSSHNEYGDSGRIILPSYNSGVWVAGISYSFWIRVYDFSKYNIMYWNGSVMFYGSQADAGASTMLGYHTSSTNPYGYTSQLQYTRVNYYTPAATASSPLPLDEWCHYSMSAEFATGEVRYYKNGNLDTVTSNSLRPDIPYLATIQSYIHNSSAFGYGFGTYDLKDFRAYNAILTAEDALAVYRHSRDFHDATSGLIRTDIVPMLVGEVIPPEPPVGFPHHHHHIIGAV